MESTYRMRVYNQIKSFVSFEKSMLDNQGFIYVSFKGIPTGFWEKLYADVWDFDYASLEVFVTSITRNGQNVRIEFE